MEILGGRKFVEVPGTATHELPPLLVQMSPQVRSLERVMGMASELVEQEDLVRVEPAAGIGQQFAGARATRSYSASRLVYTEVRVFASTIAVMDLKQLEGVPYATLGAYLALVTAACWSVMEVVARRTGPWAALLAGGCVGAAVTLDLVVAFAAATELAACARFAALTVLLVLMSVVFLLVKDIE